MTDAWLPIDRDSLISTLDLIEATLDPLQPEASGGTRVLGYGEISVALEIDALPGLVCKRMSGFADPASASAYLDLMDRYLGELAGAGVAVAPTVAVPVGRAERAPVVYLVQPRLPGDSIGNTLLRTADDETLARAIRSALDSVATVARSSRDRADGIEVAVDGQLSNWSFGGGVDGADGADAPAGEAGPVLFDVGTPFLRRNGRHVIDLEVLLAPIPPGLRAYYRRRRLIEAYLDDYFVPRTVALDLLGNFHKEGASERLGIGEGVVNEWLATADLPGPRDPIHVTEVAEYYRKDSELLALYLRLRRMDRFLRTRALRQPYDYVLPGHVAR